MIDQSGAAECFVGCRADFEEVRAGASEDARTEAELGREFVAFTASRRVRQSKQSSKYSSRSTATDKAATRSRLPRDHRHARAYAQTQAEKRGGHDRVQRGLTTS